MARKMIIGSIVVCSALFLAVPFAAAQSFRCVGKDGRKYYGSTIPPACFGKVVEQLNSQGLVIKRIDPLGEEKTRKEKEALAAKKRDQEAAARETERRNRALLATYTSEKDIEDARRRALADNEKSVREIEARIAELQKRREGYGRDLASYKGASAPQRLTDDMASAEFDLKAQQDLLAAKRKEMDVINAKYDEDSKLYHELSAGR